MRTGKVKQRGIVAILDALGASSFSDLEIEKFLKSRQLALDLLSQGLDELKGIKKLNRSKFNWFTFNDTVLLTLGTQENEIKDTEILAFFLILRRFFIDSIREGILFRGAISIGGFFADRKTNTILGSAVTDAAAWYDKADWIGLIATPKTSLELFRRQELASSEAHFACVDYDVPLQGGKKTRLKVLNWHTLIKNRVNTQNPRVWFLKCLSDHNIPAGTESKYTNSLTFFDYCAEISSATAYGLHSKTEVNT